MGTYMENQMDNLIESGLHQKDDEWELLVEKIETYIYKCGYTWSLMSIIEEYHKRKKGEYISFTAKEIINKFEVELDKFLK